MRKVQRPSRGLADQFLVLLIATGLAVWSVTVAIAEETTTDDDSHYSNPAQAAHAAQVADEAARSDAEVSQAYTDYETAVNALGDEPSEQELAEVEALEGAFQNKLAEVWVGDRSPMNSECIPQRSVWGITKISIPIRRSPKQQLETRKAASVIVLAQA
jgi:hypothetical protein